MKPSGIITLTTDFGLLDPCVGIMKGVILSIAPEARLVDLTHQVPPQDILEGALQLSRATRWFPEGTIHLAVVDPGVGSDRHPLVIVGDRYTYVGPDNGLFSLALEHDRVRQCYVVERYTLPVISATFHGRDVFAPAAAHLVRGVPADSFGRVLERPRPLKLRTLKELPNGVEAAVLLIDHFGNLITGVRPADLPFEPRLVEVKGKKIAIKTHYSQVEPGQPLALVGSDGYLEISVNQGNAARALGLGRLDRVKILR